MLPSCSMTVWLRAISRRSEEHTSELQSRRDLVCRLLLEKKKKEGRRGVARKMSDCETRPRLVCDDGGSCDVAFVLLDVGHLARFQEEFVGDDLITRIALP